MSHQGVQSSEVGSIVSQYLRVFDIESGGQNFQDELEGMLLRVICE
jgi:hypothetical protein